MILIDTSKFDLVSTRKLIDKFIAKRVERISLSAYRSALEIYPFWSGTYASNWTIDVGLLDTTAPNQAPQYRGGRPEVQYLAPRQPNTLPSLYSNPYQKVYIVNATPYAAMIEYVGTPRHTSPWMIANHAYNTTLAKFRFF